MNIFQHIAWKILFIKTQGSKMSTITTNFVKLKELPKKWYTDLPQLECLCLLESLQNRVVAMCCPNRSS